MKKTLKSIFSNGLVYATLYLWLFDGMQWAGNLYRFYLPVITVIMLFLLLMSTTKEFKKHLAGSETYGESSSIIRILSYIETGVLVAFAHPWLAAMNLFCIFTAAIIRHGVKEGRKKLATA